MKDRAQEFHDKASTFIWVQTRKLGQILMEDNSMKLGLDFELSSVMFFIKKFGPKK